MKLALVLAFLSMTAVGCASTFGEEDVDGPQVAGGGIDPQSSVHLKGGKSASPAFTDNGLSLSSTGALSGLGNGDVIINLTAVGNPIATCTNPAGATQPPGQNPAEVTLTGTQSIPSSEIKNGTVSFSVGSSAPDSPVAGAPGCPNKQWAEAIVDVSFTSASITVSQNGAQVLSLSCTFSPSTSNGPVPSGTVTCK